MSGCLFVYVDGYHNIIPRNMCKRSDHTKPVNMSMAWLEQFGSDFCDKMPDSEKINLPSSMTRNDVYERMTVELGTWGMTSVAKVYSSSCGGRITRIL